MKIPAAENKYNIIPRAFAIFPLFFALATLSIGVNTGAVIFYAASGVLAAGFVYTFFFTTYEKYLDTETRQVVRHIKWLWLGLRKAEDLDKYTAICLCIGGSVATSNWTNAIKATYYDVVLVRKHASTNTFHGFGHMENVLLRTLIRDPAKAQDYARHIAAQIGFEVIVDSEVRRFFTPDRHPPRQD